MNLSLLENKSYRFSQAPFSRVGVPLHDNPLDLGHHPVVAGGDGCGCHESDGDADGLALGGYGHYLLVHGNVVVVPQHARQHNFGPVANGGHRRVLHDDPLVLRQEGLHGPDDASQRSLVVILLVLVLRVQEVVECHHAVIFRVVAGANSPELLHVRSHPEVKAQVDAHCSDVCTGLT